MSMEGGGRFEWDPRPKLSRELLETRYNPELVFSGSLEEADKEHQEVQIILDNLIEGTTRFKSAEIAVETSLGSSHPTVAVRWPARNNHARQLTLHPISDGKGPEAGVVGHTGSYDIIKIDPTTGEEKVKSRTRLEDLFKAPHGIRFAIKPTLTRWAVGQDEMAFFFGDENVYTLYVGLGFLCLGEPWMLIGFHEAGHIPKNYTKKGTSLRGENTAWKKGKRAYASINHGKGKGIGLFGLLQPPTFDAEQGYRTNYDSHPTIGEIEKYGLTSYGMDPSIRLPRQWMGDNFSKTQEDMRRFREIIVKAQESFSQLLYR